MPRLGTKRLLTINTGKLFGDSASEWIRYECAPGNLGLVADVCFGHCGVEGHLGLLIPPGKHSSDDAWEGSCAPGRWDQWAFLSFITIPPSGGQNRWKGGLQILIFFSEDTFFDRPQELVRTLLIADELEHGALVAHFGDPDGTDGLEAAADTFIQVLTRELGAAVETELAGDG